MIYHIIALVVAILAIIKGYRQGFRRQMPLVIGFCFGIVCARLFSVPVEEGVRELLPSIAGKPEADFAYSVISRGVIYVVVYEIFSLCTGFLRLLFLKISSGVLDSICGAVMATARYLLMLSVGFNFLLCWQTDSQLLRYAESDDGNIVEEVMLIAPALLGGDSVEDLAHTLQLEAAKCIS